MEPVLSPEKDKGGPPPCTEVKEHDLLRSHDTRPLDNKNGKVDKARVATGIIVTTAAAGKKPAAFILSIHTFNSRLWNKNEILSWRTDLGDIRYVLGAYYNNSLVEPVFSPNIY